MLLVGVVACGWGAVPSPNVSSGGGPGPGRAGQVLEGEQGPDQAVQIAVDGDQVVVVTVSDHGVLTGHRYLRLGGVTRFGDGWMALGSGGLPTGVPPCGPWRGPGW